MNTPNWNGSFLQMDDNENLLLFHRTSEIAQLRAAFHRGTHPREQPELVLITGPSGTGKTALAHSIQPLAETSGFFLVGKYDLLERPENYYPIIHALTQFIQNMTEMSYSTQISDNTISHMKSTITKVVETEPLLLDMIPALREWLQMDSPKVTPTIRGGAETKKRFHMALSRLLEAIASPQHPLVLLLDDLQWAETASIDLLLTLMSGAPIPGLVLLATVRGDDLSNYQLPHVSSSCTTR
jgi:histidine kinase